VRRRNFVVLGAVDAAGAEISFLLCFSPFHPLKTLLTKMQKTREKGEAVE
jgi:hypothetical protein